MRNNFVSCKVWCRYKSVIDNKDPKTQELMRFMHQSPLSVSMHQNTQQLSAINEGETILFHNKCAMRAEQIDANDDVWSLIVQSKNKSIKAGSYYYFDNFCEVEELSNSALFFLDNVMF